MLHGAHQTKAASAATDDASLVEDTGAPVVVVPDHPGNIKVTTPEDLVVAQALARERAP